MDKINELYNHLESYLNSIKSKFIDQYLPAKPGDTPDMYRDDVKAYCLLSHALFEDFYEKVALTVMEVSIERYRTKAEITKPLLTMLSYSNTRFPIEEKIDKKMGFNPNNKAFDRIRKTLEDTKAQISTEIENNHGMSIKYLPSILLPVHINITSDPIILGSLSELAKARGEYAHGRADYTIAPERSVEIVEDCLRLCENVKLQAIINLDESEFKTSLIMRILNSLNNQIKK